MTREHLGASISGQHEMIRKDVLAYVDHLESEMYKLTAERDRLREAVKTCRAYARYPVSLDDCFMIFNEADIALQEVEG